MADATGAGAAEGHKKQEIGTEGLKPKLVETLEQDLEINPPQTFDVARALRVFSSRVQYVELEVMNYRLSSRQVQLPPELLNITDDELRARISGRIRTPVGELGKLKIDIETANGVKELEIDEGWLTKERRRIEDRYTYPIPRFGRVILNTDRKGFDEEIARYKHVVMAYQKAVIGELEELRSKFEQRVVAEYLPGRKQKSRPRISRDICQNPPQAISRTICEASPNGYSLARSISRRLMSAWSTRISHPS